MDWFYPQIIDPSSGNKTQFKQATSKVVCVGRNYIAHAKELNNPVPSRPLLFIKPNTCLVALEKPINISGLSKHVEQSVRCDYELEVAILIGEKLTHATDEQIKKSIAGVGLALDLTLREEQSKLKQKGHPWERAKAFDGACPISHFLSWQEEINLNNIAFQFSIDGKVAQTGNTSDAIFKVIPLIKAISAQFTLLSGDIVLTGTPEGVAPLKVGSQLSFELLGKAWENTPVI